MRKESSLHRLHLIDIVKKTSRIHFFSIKLIEIYGLGNLLRRWRLDRQRRWLCACVLYVLRCNYKSIAKRQIFNSFNQQTGFATFSCGIFTMECNAHKNKTCMDLGIFRYFFVLCSVCWVHNRRWVVFIYLISPFKLFSCWKFFFFFFKKLCCASISCIKWFG